MAGFWQPETATSKARDTNEHRKLSRFKKHLLERDGRAVSSYCIGKRPLKGTGAEKSRAIPFHIGIRRNGRRRSFIVRAIGSVQRATPNPCAVFRGPHCRVRIAQGPGADLQQSPAKYPQECSRTRPRRVDRTGSLTKYKSSHWLIRTMRHADKAAEAICIYRIGRANPRCTASR